MKALTCKTSERPAVQQLFFRRRPARTLHITFNWNKMWLNLLAVTEHCNTLRSQIQINRWLPEKWALQPAQRHLSQYLSKRSVCCSTQPAIHLLTYDLRELAHAAAAQSTWTECARTANCCYQFDRTLTALRKEPTSVAPRGLVRRRYQSCRVTRVQAAIERAWLCCLLLTDLKRCASQNSCTILRHSIGQETTDLCVDMDTTQLCMSQNKMHNSGITPIG